MLEKLLFSNLMSKNSSLLFNIEQWELTRRLRNSGLSKEQLCQAFDDLDRMERELGNLYSLPTGANSSTSSTSTSPPLSSTSSSSQHTSNNHLALNKAATAMNNVSFQHLIAANNAATAAAGGAGNCKPANGGLKTSADSIGDQSSASGQSAPNAAAIINAHFAQLVDFEAENREMEEFRMKGEVAIHSEISFFVYKYDLKQSQIARMAGVNQAYVSKFLRGEFFDLSENGKSLIYKWYLRFLHSPAIYRE